MSTPLLSNGDAFLRAWHARYPGATAGVFTRMREANGRCSYDRLVDLASAQGPDAVVLDLACGDGYLLAAIAGTPGSPWELIGLDMSPDELGAARVRLGERATLHLGHATTLPLSDASVDVVTCHMALMLMGEVEAVLAELARVLRPGGVFGAVVGGRTRNPTFDAFLGPLDAISAGEAAPPLELGDPRTRREAGLRALLAGDSWEQPLEIEDFTVSFTGPPAAAWPLLARMYNPDRLSEAGQAALESRTLLAWQNLQDTDGHVTLAMGLRWITARRIGP